MPAPQKRLRLKKLFRVFPAEKQLLQWLGSENDFESVDRYQALVKLADIVPSLELEYLADLQRQPVQLQVPLELDEALAAKKKATGQPYVSILLEAAATYRKRQIGSRKSKRLNTGAK